MTQCNVAALNLSPLDTYAYPDEVAWEIDQNSKNDHIHLAQVFNADRDISGVIVQHEYGIFGGRDGRMLLEFMKLCTKPMLVTLHTTLPNPSPHMQNVTKQIIARANTIVVLTESSKRIIEHLYPHAVGKVFVIPHGIHPCIFSDPHPYKKKLDLEHRTILTTFGLLSQGKGIEYAIRALPEVIKKYPSVLYLILGETHPVIRRNEGEKYRLSLAKLVKELGLEKHVKFYDQYFNLPDLLEFLQATDIYIATSTNPNQAVSGTLSYALGTGRAVISTNFAQAKEIVTPDIGRLVPVHDAPALTGAILDLLSDKIRLKQMHANAYAQTRPMLWSHVAEHYANLLTRLIIPPLNLSHLHAMTDRVGLFQFAKITTPDTAFGYTLDDNARALVVCSWLIRDTKTTELERLIHTYLQFIVSCQTDTGAFTNYIGYDDRLPTAQNKTEDLEDTQMRTLWALSETVANLNIAEPMRTQAQQILMQHLTHPPILTHLRAKAFAIKALAVAYPMLHTTPIDVKAQIATHANALVAAFTTNAIKSWRWFEPDLRYSNALLSESLLTAGEILQNDTYTKIGLASLDFLISKTFSTIYMPIGHTLWYKNKKERSSYDQQPEDPASTILALVRAYQVTHKEHYKTLAQTCFRWFLGYNSLNMPLYDRTTGGCCDGLHPDRVNRNQGAESLISYLMSRIVIQQI